MDWQLEANANGHISCTQGGECLAGLVEAVESHIVGPGETAVLDATAHALKFAEFQNLYFDARLSDGYNIVSDPDKINKPELVLPDDPEKIPTQEKRLKQDDLDNFVRDIAGKIADRLKLEKS